MSRNNRFERPRFVALVSIGTGGGPLELPAATAAVLDKR